MKLFFILLLSLIITSSSSFYDDCVKGDFEYSMATYPDLNNTYQKLFDSLLHQSVLQFIRHQKIKGLPTKDTHKLSHISPSKSIVIEPLYIDLTTFNGLYTYRSYSLEKKVRTGHYRCGYYHYTFLLSDNNYISFTEDTLQNEKLINQYLRGTFAEKDISKIIEDYKYDIICDDYTNLPPVLIKKGDSVLFDINKLPYE